jgi:hypothetical protein
MPNKCQVLFFPMLFVQTNDKLKKLDEMQRELANCAWEMDLACKDQWEFILRREALAQSMRNKWKLYKTPHCGIKAS